MGVVLFWDPNQTHKYAVLLAAGRIFNIKLGGVVRIVATRYLIIKNGEPRVHVTANSHYFA